MVSNRVAKLTAESHPSLTRELLPEFFEDPHKCGWCVHARKNVGGKWRCNRHNVSITWEDTCADHARISA